MWGLVLGVSARLKGRSPNLSRALISSGNKYFSFKNQQENYYTNASVRDLCEENFPARFLKDT